MKCMYLKYRSKNYIRYLYCTLKKDKIKYDDCKKCKFKLYKEVKPIKQRTSKQNKLEKNRKSVFTDNLNICIECGKLKDHLHEIYRGKNRHKSIAYSFVLPLCNTCHTKIHNSPKMTLKWQIKGQVKFEENNTRENFVKEFGQSYL